MTKSSFALILVAVITFFVFRWIAKLPSRYERNPARLSPWNSLDRGIDPTLPAESDE
jgi:hypothetical protein